MYKLAIIGMIVLSELATITVAADRRPNIVVILADDLGAMDIGASNPSTFYETPNVDRLAREGMRFTKAYAANPVCSPTRYSIMTGKYPTRGHCTNYFTGVREARFRGAPFDSAMLPDEYTLAEALKSVGYRTAIVGKWHLGQTVPSSPERQGFDTYFAGRDQGSRARGYFVPSRGPLPKNGAESEYLTDRLAEEAVKVIGSMRDGPFLLYFAQYAVHTPLQAPAELITKYEAKARRLGLVDKAEFGDEEQVWEVGAPRKVRVLQRHATYAAMVETMDRAVGRVLAELERLGLAENTIVCFMSDNGGLSTSEGSPTSNLPFRGGKGWVYEGGIRVPLILKWPGVVAPSSTCAVPVMSLDLYPTLAEVAGATIPAGQSVDGVSLVPWLKGGRGSAHDALFWHYPHYSNQGGFPGGAVQMGDWKLIERYEDGRTHLYNLADDVGERNDLAAAMPERAAALRERLHDWYRDVDARFLEPRPGGPMPWRPAR